MSFLLWELRDGSRLVNDLRQSLKRQDFKFDTLERAAKSLAITKRKTRFQRKLEWSLPSMTVWLLNR